MKTMSQRNEIPSQVKASKQSNQVSYPGLSDKVYTPNHYTMLTPWNCFYDLPFCPQHLNTPVGMQQALYKYQLNE